MSDDIFQVGDTTARPGTKVTGFLTVPGTSVQMPMTVVNGKESGPSLLITGGVHGGEYPPIEAVIRLARELDPTERMAAALHELTNQPKPSEVRIPGLLDGLSVISETVDQWLSPAGVHLSLVKQSS